MTARPRWTTSTRNGSAAVLRHTAQARLRHPSAGQAALRGAHRRAAEPARPRCRCSTSAVRTASTPPCCDATPQWTNSTNGTDGATLARPTRCSRGPGDGGGPAAARGTRFVGLDISPDALAYARESGFIDAGVLADLESHEPTAQQRAELAGTDLAISTGCLGYITERTLARVVRGQRRPSTVDGPFRAADVPVRTGRAVPGRVRLRDHDRRAAVPAASVRLARGAGPRARHAHRPRRGPDRPGGRRLALRPTVHLPTARARSAAS